MTKAKWIAAFTGALTMLAAPAAFAGELGSPTGGYGSAGLLLGAATANYLTFGLGLRGGYTFQNTPVYVGGTFIYHFGADNAHTFVFGVEGGYDFVAGPVVVRPYLGLGDALVEGSSVNVPSVTIPGVGTVGGGSFGGGSSSEFALWPGVTVMYPIQQFFVGGDARVYIIPDVNHDAASFGLYATGGMSF